MGWEDPQSHALGKWTEGKGEREGDGPKKQKRQWSEEWSELIY